MLPGSEVLATAYSDKSKDPRNTGKQEPVVWVATYGKGRVCANVLGHDLEAMKSAGFQTLLIRGVEWAATGRNDFSPARRVEAGQVSWYLPRRERLPEAHRSPCWRRGLGDNVETEKGGSGGTPALLAATSRKRSVFLGGFAPSLERGRLVRSARVAPGVGLPRRVAKTSGAFVRFLPQGNGRHLRNGGMEGERQELLVGLLGENEHGGYPFQARCAAPDREGAQQPTTPVRERR